MKKKQFNKKLSLKKEVISKLDKIKGGGIGADNEDYYTKVQNTCIRTECHAPATREGAPNSMCICW